MRRITPLLTTALLAAALGAIPAPAHASRSQESLFQDDANLLFTSDARRNATLNELRALGVDVIRLNVVWNQYAPWTGLLRSGASHAERRRHAGGRRASRRGAG